MSDTHLGAAPAEVERQLLGFLRAVSSAARTLVINGDLFDFWFEWRTVIPRTGFRILAALADLRDAGIDVVWIAGNHDCWGGEVLQRDVGVAYHVGAWEGGVAGWRARIDHGDGLRPREDRRYRALRRVLRHPFSIRSFRWLHPDLGTSLATGSSTASRVHRARDGGAGLRRIAFDTLASAPALDLLVFGHSHVAALERAPGGGVYANAGSWLEAPTFLALDAERVELRAWDGSAEGRRLDALDRRSEEALPEA
ncbi:MAG TPA: UDP-2,3-diacylglucosamine diphosphatase [Gemmatimonadaceae bacterium]|nr:UDP-2,3-diacylglucosamine diphosphatase [Gemmatimonadaceae bacterium]